MGGVKSKKASYQPKEKPTPEFSQNDRLDNFLYPEFRQSLKRTMTKHAQIRSSIENLKYFGAKPEKEDLKNIPEESSVEDDYVNVNFNNDLDAKEELLEISTKLKHLRKKIKNNDLAGVDDELNNCLLHLGKVRSNEVPIQNLIIKIGQKIGQYQKTVEKKSNKIEKPSRKSNSRIATELFETLNTELNIIMEDINQFEGTSTEPKYQTILDHLNHCKNIVDKIEAGNNLQIANAKTEYQNYITARIAKFSATVNENEIVLNNQCTNETDDEFFDCVDDSVLYQNVPTKVKDKIIVNDHIYEDISLRNFEIISGEEDTEIVNKNKVEKTIKEIKTSATDNISDKEINNRTNKDGKEINKENNKEIDKPINKDISNKIVNKINEEKSIEFKENLKNTAEIKNNEEVRDVKNPEKYKEENKIENVESKPKDQILMHKSQNKIVLEHINDNKKDTQNKTNVGIEEKSLPQDEVVYRNKSEIYATVNKPKPGPKVDAKVKYSVKNEYLNIISKYITRPKSKSEVVSGKEEANVKSDHVYENEFYENGNLFKIDYKFHGKLEEDIDAIENKVNIKTGIAKEEELFFGSTSKQNDEIIDKKTNIEQKESNIKNNEEVNQTGKDQNGEDQNDETQNRKVENSDALNGKTQNSNGEFIINKEIDSIASKSENNDSKNTKDKINIDQNSTKEIDLNQNRKDQNNENQNGQNQNGDNEKLNYDKQCNEEQNDKNQIKNEHQNNEKQQNVKQNDEEQYITDQNNKNEVNVEQNSKNQVINDENNEHRNSNDQNYQSHSNYNDENKNDQNDNIRNQNNEHQNNTQQKIDTSEQQSLNSNKINYKNKTEEIEAQSKNSNQKLKDLNLKTVNSLETHDQVELENDNINGLNYTKISAQLKDDLNNTISQSHSSQIEINSGDKNKSNEDIVLLTKKHEEALLESDEVYDENMSNESNNQFKEKLEKQFKEQYKEHDENTFENKLEKQIENQFKNESESEFERNSAIIDMRQNDTELELIPNSEEGKTKIIRKSLLDDDPKDTYVPIYSPEEEEEQQDEVAELPTKKTDCNREMQTLNEVKDCVAEVRLCIEQFEGNQRDQNYTDINVALTDAMKLLNRLKSTNPEAIAYSQRILMDVFKCMQDLDAKAQK